MQTLNLDHFGKSDIKFAWCIHFFGYSKKLLSFWIYVWSSLLSA